MSSGVFNVTLERDETHPASEAFLNEFLAGRIIIGAHRPAKMLVLEDSTTVTFESDMDCYYRFHVDDFDFDLSRTSNIVRKVEETRVGEDLFRYTFMALGGEIGHVDVFEEHGYTVEPHPAYSPDPRTAFSVAVRIRRLCFTPEEDGDAVE